MSKRPTPAHGVPAVGAFGAVGVVVGPATRARLCIMAAAAAAAAAAAVAATTVASCCVMVLLLLLLLSSRGRLVLANTRCMVSKNKLQRKKKVVVVGLVCVSFILLGQRRGGERLAVGV